MTFYFYPLACSIFTSSATAQVQGDGKLKSLRTTIDPFANVKDPAKPFIRSPPTLEIEKQFVNLTNALYLLESQDISNVAAGGGSIEFAWLEYTLMDRVANATGMAAVEDSLAYVTSLAYAVRSQGWRDQLAGSAYSDAALKTLAPNWIPSNITLNGTEPVLFARLKVEGRPLIITFISTLVLVVVTIVSTYGHADAHIDHVVRDGAVIDILSLMAESSLPMIIGEGAEYEVDGRDGRRVRAERTLVS